MGFTPTLITHSPHHSSIRSHPLGAPDLGLRNRAGVGACSLSKQMSTRKLTFYLGLVTYPRPLSHFHTKHTSTAKRPAFPSWPWSPLNWTSKREFAFSLHRLWPEASRRTTPDRIPGCSGSLIPLEFAGFGGPNWGWRAWGGR